MSSYALVQPWFLAQIGFDPCFSTYGCLQQPEQRDGGGPGEVGATEAFAGQGIEVLEEAMAADQRQGILAQPIR
jgi:hypothetical protein